MCTAVRFSDAKGNMYFGRNLDWSCGYGQKVVITPRGWQAPYRFIDSAPTQQAIIGMGIIEQNYPLYFDCANENGLACAGLNFPGFAQYAASPVDDRTNIAAFEFPFWVVDKFASVDEAEEALRNVVIVNEPINDGMPCSLLHWIIGDGKRSIVVEHMPDGIHVYRDDADVLANQPTFPWHLENLRNYVAQNPDVPTDAAWRDALLSAYGSGAGMRGIPGDYYSTSRFAKVAYLNAFHPDVEGEADNISRLFHELGNVSMCLGGAKMTNGEFEKTIYTGGYSSLTKTYYFNCYEDPTIRKVSLSEYANGTELIAVD